MPLNFKLLSSLPSAQAQTRPDRKAEADRLFQQGNEQYQISRFGVALQAWQQALKIYRELKDREGEEDTLGNLGIAYFSLSNYNKAIEYQQKRLTIAREIKDQLGEEQALGNLGVVYDHLGNYNKAIEYQEERLTIAREIKDQLGEGQALGNLGNAYLSLGNYDKAIVYQERALTILRQIKDRLGEAETLGNLGGLYSNIGNYDKAITYQEQALTILRELKNRQKEGQVLGALGDTYLSLGNYNKAIAYQEQSLAIAQEIEDKFGEGESLGGLGLIYLYLGNYSKAIEYQEKHLVVVRQIKERSEEGSALNLLGVAYDHLGDYSKAIEYYKQALAILKGIKNLRGEGQALGNLGVAYFNLEDYGKAIAYQEQSLAITRQIKDRPEEGQALNNLGLVLFKSGHLAAAANALMNGIFAWEDLRQTGVGNNDINQVSIFEAQARTYRILQQVLIAQNQPNAALEVAERGRARAFVELLAQRLVNQEPGVKPPNLQQIQQIARAQNATLVQYSIIYDDFKVEGKEQAQDSALYIWVIQPNGKVSFRQTDLKPLWQEQHTTLAAFVKNSRKGIGVLDRTAGGLVAEATPGNDSSVNPLTKLQQLHQLLIEPIADLLPRDPTAHVIFMPQASLFLVPFAALLDKSNHYLIEQHTISIAPSIQVLSFTHQQQAALPKTATPSVLVAGDPTMPKVLIPGEDAPLTLPDLPGAKQEAIAVAKTLNTTALIGNQATKHAVLQQMQTARIIHLATHGLLDDFRGLGIPGAIALAPDGNGQSNDGLLTADDILNMKLKAELVVLSACDTGQGRLTGDGVIGLSRSLISAGVPSVIVSLWSIPDAPTASLMTQFYQNLQRHPDKAQALRQAMLSTMKTNPDPIDWAAFTLIGEAQ